MSTLSGSRRWSAVLVLVALCGVASGLAAENVTSQDNDPAGDLLSPEATLDLRSLAALLEANELLIELGFASPPPLPGAGLFGTVDVEVADGSGSQLPAVDFLSPFSTGLSGDLHVDLGSYEESDGSADLVADSSGEIVDRVPLEIDGERLALRVPREWVGDSARVAAVVGDEEWPSDVAPNGGYVTTADAASEPGAVLLNGERFAVVVQWRTAQGQSGTAQMATRADDSAVLWFFAPDNWEMLVKLLDGCGINGHFWLLAAATTNVGLRMQVTDTASGTVREYLNPLGESAVPVFDLEAFATCP